MRTVSNINVHHLIQRAGAVVSQPESMFPCLGMIIIPRVSVFHALIIEKTGVTS